MSSSASLCIGRASLRETMGCQRDGPNRWSNVWVKRTSACALCIFLPIEAPPRRGLHPAPLRLARFLKRHSVMDQFQEQIDRISQGRGFIAALDQSGGSTPKALEAYGVGPENYSNDEEMFDAVHAMRSRIIADPSFTGDRIVAAILFEGTMDRDVEGLQTPKYLWERKRIVPFVKVDQGLAEKERGSQLMKPMPGLDRLLRRAKGFGVAGTKMRSLVHEANEEGIAAVVEQQFEFAQRILDAALVPIVEPEISIKCPRKKEAEAILLERLRSALDQMGPGKRVVLKLTLPEVENLYEPLTLHPGVLRVVALSGGYSREEANRKLSRNRGVIASFSRALSEDLNARQNDAEFTEALDRTIESIFRASVEKA